MPADSAALSLLLEPALAAEGFDLEEVTVTRAGRRQVVRVVVDRDAGLDLDAVAAASRLVDGALEDHDHAGGGGGGGAVAGEYVLEVTSPGVDRPLTAPRHWRRAVGRLVQVSLRAGSPVTGRLTAAGELAATVSPVPVRGRPGGAPVEVAYDEVSLALVQVEFSRPDETDQTDQSHQTDQTDEEQA